MKKFFTLIAAVAMAASVNAQTVYSFAGCTQESFTYEDSWFKYDATNKQFDYLTGSKSEYAALSLKDSPLSLLYKNSGAKTKVFTISDKYLCAQAKGTQISVSGLTEGQEVAFSVASKGSKASAFVLVSGGSVESMPTFNAKPTDADPTFQTIKVKATDKTIVLKETAGGFDIENVTITGTGTSGISNINASEAANEGATFNLMGQKVASNAKGLVIKNGKKFINK